MAETASQLYSELVNIDATYAVNTARPDLDEWVVNTQQAFHQAVEDPLSVHRDRFVILAREELAVEPPKRGLRARLGL